VSFPIPLIHGPAALDALGWNARLASQFEPFGAAGLLAGRVSRVDRGAALVITLQGELRATPSAALLRGATGADALPATGDWVARRRARG
jgi:ribosome biogenesis GTPase